MKNRLLLTLITGMVLLMSASSWVSARSTDADNGFFTEADQEFYMPENLVFFLRPGVDFTLIEFEIPSDLQPLVTFRLTDPSGRPLDREGIETPGPVDTRFMLTYIPLGEEQKVSYHDRLRDRDGEYTDLGDGVYTYKFTTVLPADYETDATHTLGSVATRDFRTPEFDFLGLEGRYYDNDVYNFIPSGSGEPMPRDVVRTATCNRCHDPLGEHGGRYQEVQICQQCHNPGLFNEEAGLSYSFDNVIHRVHSNNEPELDHEIHYPPELNACNVCHTGGIPTDDQLLVANPNPIEICDPSAVGMTTLSWGDAGSVQIRLDTADGKLVGSASGAGSTTTGKWIKDGRVFVLVDTGSGEAIDELTVDGSVFGCAGNAPGTFRGEPGVLHTRWMTRPSRGVCGGCHADIDFETGEGHIAQSNDDNCGLCHQPMGEEYDASVSGAHTVDYRSTQLGGVLVTIKNITQVGPGQRPNVTFSLTDKWGYLDPSVLGRLRFALAGPNEDFSFYHQEDVLSKLVASGNNWAFTFGTPLPSNAKGSYSLGVEGRINEVLINEGQDDEFGIRDQMQNFIEPFAIGGGEGDSRRMVVDDEKCESCHDNLSLHGANRHNANGYCQTCHRPDLTDHEVRLEGNDESVHFKYMIHKIHRGEDLVNGYVVYGYRSSIHDYSHVAYPGDLRNCEACHLEDTYGIPLPEGVLPTVSPNTLLNPMQPTAAACLSCHDSDEAAIHADANTSDLGESCVTCHGEGRSASVQRVHAR